MKERVEFDAHKLVNKATKVAFTTKSGEKVLFSCREADPRCCSTLHSVPGEQLALDRLICAG